MKYCPCTYVIYVIGGKDGIWFAKEQVTRFDPTSVLGCSQPWPWDLSPVSNAFKSCQQISKIMSENIQQTITVLFLFHFYLLFPLPVITHGLSIVYFDRCGYIDWCVKGKANTLKENKSNGIFISAWSLLLQNKNTLHHDMGEREENLRRWRWGEKECVCERECQTGTREII